MTGKRCRPYSFIFILFVFIIAFSFGESIKSVDSIFTPGSGISSSIEEHKFTEGKKDVKLIAD